MKLLKAWNRRSHVGAPGSLKMRQHMRQRFFRSRLPSSQPSNERCPAQP